MNIIGRLPGRYTGTRDDKMVLIGSHYDTVQTSPGVDDNGSGITALLQALKLISSPGTVTLLLSLLCLWSHRCPKLTMRRLYSLTGFQFIYLLLRDSDKRSINFKPLKHNTSVCCKAPRVSFCVFRLNRYVIVYVGSICDVSLNGRIKYQILF